VSAAHDPMPTDWPSLSGSAGASALEPGADVSVDSLAPLAKHAPATRTLVEVPGSGAMAQAPAASKADPDCAAPSGERPAPPRTWRNRRGVRGLPDLRWPLVAVLLVQALLSLRLIWSNTAFQDEALYLRAGHLEWAQWLHGTPIPDFPSYFSGSPAIYPPIGALADSIGGLAAARLLSLCFMLGVTSLLWLTTVRLYGRRAALLATALFGTLAGTQFLGAFATFDALALFLLSLAAWLGVRSADCQLWSRITLLIGTGVILAAADAVKYATALFTPVVLILVALTAWRQRGAPAGLAASFGVLCSWLVLAVAVVAAGGHEYWVGITTSTLDRPQSNFAVTTVLQHAYVWMSLILVLAVLGSVLATRIERRAKLLPAVLTAAALLAPVEQARLHTTVSLQKHVVFGAWFAAIAAGYAMACLSRVDPGRGWAAVMALPIAASTLFGSMGQAASLYEVWPNSAAVIRVLQSAVHSHPGNYLAEDYDVEAYYLRADVPWRRWSNTYYFRYPGALPGAPSFETAIGRHYFSLVILDFGDTAVTDREITADMHRAGGYYVMARAGRFTVWALRETAPAQRSGGGAHG
jgi:4-amino-4-deoxy-L-arabinose transferase-like glycosyltransferase